MPAVLLSNKKMPIYAHSSRHRGDDGYSPDEAAIADYSLIDDESRGHPQLDLVLSSQVVPRTFRIRRCRNLQKFRNV